jgi:hypothetical protein
LPRQVCLRRQLLALDEAPTGTESGNLRSSPSFAYHGDLLLPVDGFHGGSPGQVDAVMRSGQTDDMAPSDDLIAVDVHTDDVGDYSVSEAGWYAVDDAGRVVLGPFSSLAECERAIRDRTQHAAPKVAN